MTKAKIVKLGGIRLQLLSSYHLSSQINMTDPTPNPISLEPTVNTPKVARSARGRPADDDDTRHSKTLSYILRHGAAKESLLLRPDGFVRVAELVCSVIPALSR